MSSSVVDEVSNDACGICSSGSSSEQIMSTSCDKKMKDGVCGNILCITNTTSSISDGINSMNISNDNTLTEANDSIPVCANCGKEGDDVNNTCNKCKMVLYCNAACKKKHRHKHKKDCEEHLRLAAERAAELHDIELFKQPPLLHEDCPICFLRIPTLITGWRHQTCCGKVICSGCIYAPVYDNQGNEVDNKKCPFCRVPTPTVEERIELEKKRVKAGDPIAIYNTGMYYRDGTNGYQQDHTKALECWHRAAELGLSEAYNNVGGAYLYGQGVEIDTKKTVYYYELAAIMGNVSARCNLGIIMEKCKGKMDRVLKHYAIAVEGGDTKSLDAIKELYSKGHASKDDYTKALQLYQVYLGEIKSEQRDQAAAANEDYRYY